MEWPEWWEWELEFTPHIEKRMEDRDFTEVDLREMLEKARDYRPDVIEGRWIVETRRKRQKWEVVVDPDREGKLLVLVTAYPLEK